MLFQAALSAKPNIKHKADFFMSPSKITSDILYIEHISGTHRHTTPSAIVFTFFYINRKGGTDSVGEHIKRQYEMASHRKRWIYSNINLPYIELNLLLRV